MKDGERVFKHDASINNGMEGSKHDMGSPGKKTKDICCTIHMK